MEITEDTIRQNHPIVFWATMGMLYAIYGALLAFGAAAYIGLGYEILHHLHVL